MADKKFFTERDLLESGAILKEYTQTDFIAVCPVPAIGKVKFSIVKQGTNGKDYSSFYLGMERFRLLCEELCSESGTDKLVQSTDHPYPDAYKFASGTEGSKRLNIGGGRKGVRIQIQEKKEGKTWMNRMIAVPYDALLSMKFRFELVMGLIPASHYYESLVEIFWKGAEERDKYFRKSYRETDDEDYGAETGNPVTADTPSEEPKPAPESESEPEVPVYTLQTLGAVRRSGNTYYCQVKDTASGNRYNLCFTPAYLSNMGDKWEKFQERSADGVKIRIHGTIQNHNIQFLNIA